GDDPEDGIRQGPLPGTQEVDRVGGTRGSRCARLIVAASWSLGASRSHRSVPSHRSPGCRLTYDSSHAIAVAASAVSTSASVPSAADGFPRINVIFPSGV